MCKEDIKFMGMDFFPTIGLKVTLSCKMNCPFCCEGIKDNVEYEPEIFINLIKILSKAGTKRICFTGGEPLLYPYINTIIEYANRKKIETILLTSDGKALNSLSVEPKYITSIRISIHGIGKSHDNVVGRCGAFQEIENALNSIKSKYNNIYVATVLTTQNYNEINSISEWCISKGIKRFYIFNLLSSGLGKEYIDYNGRISSESFNKIIIEQQEKFQSSLRIIPHPYEKNAECIIVYGNGDVVIDPCFGCSNCQKKIGNLVNEKPQKILKNLYNDHIIWNDCMERFIRSTLFIPDKEGRGNE